MAGDPFGISILDAENLLMQFNTLNTNPPRLELETLKRTGLIMEMTAWRIMSRIVMEATATRICGLKDSSIGQFIKRNLMTKSGHCTVPNRKRQYNCFATPLGWISPTTLE